VRSYQIAGTSLEVSRIGYGCMRIGGTWTRDPLTVQDRNKAVRAVRAALDQGITLFDHADIYTRGKSEEVFSEMWREVPSLRERVVLQSKCGIRLSGDPEDGSPGRYDFSYEHIVGSVEASLRRLQTDYLDILLLHRPDPLVEPEEVARAFDELQQGGKVRYFGVSNHTAAQIELLRRWVDQPLVVNQLEVSVLHTHLIDAGIVFNQDDPPRPVRGEGTLEYCRLHDITIQAWSPLAVGAVLGARATEDERAAQVSQEIAVIAEGKGVSGEAIAVAWLLRHPARIQPIVGSTKPERIRAACQADAVTLTREEWYRLFVAGRGGPMP
jgi:predicted oxidoreductase